MGLIDSLRSMFGLGRKPRESDDQLDQLDQLDHREQARQHDAGDVDTDFESGSFDSGSFDFDRDIARYFTAEFRIETATHDPVRRSSLFAEYHVESLEHWQRIQAAFERWLETPAAKAKYRTPNDLMQARMTTTQTMTLADLGIEHVKLDPIDGLSLEQWAKAEAALEAGAELDGLIGELGIDAQSWAKIAAAWHQRMHDDASGRIATEYSLHVGNAGPGKFTVKTRPTS